MKRINYFFFTIICAILLSSAASANSASRSLERYETAFQKAAHFTRDELSALESHKEYVCETHGFGQNANDVEKERVGGSRFSIHRNGFDMLRVHFYPKNKDFLTFWNHKISDDDTTEPGKVILSGNRDKNFHIEIRKPLTAGNVAIIKYYQLRKDNKASFIVFASCHKPTRSKHK